MTQINNSTDKLEVLQTYEDYYPEPVSDIDYNSTSVIYRMSIEGQTFVFLGDSTAASEELLVEQFGDYIKCDVLQLAHHGLDGTVESYKLYNPEYCIMPGNQGAVFQLYKQWANSWLLNESTALKNFLVTGFGTFTTKLPINITGEYAEHIYDEDYVNPSVYE